MTATCFFGPAKPCGTTTSFNSPLSVCVCVCVYAYMYI